jgi:hypothetical protein
MDHSQVHELLARIETLERANRRWKVIGISLLSVLAVLLVLGGVFSVGAAFMVRDQRDAALHAREEALRERDAAQQAHQAAMQEREVAERAHQAAMQAEQQARQAAEQKASDNGR